MDKPALEKKVSGKLSKVSKEFVPTAKLENKGKTFHPTVEEQVPVVDSNVQNFQGYEPQDLEHYPPQFQNIQENPQYDPYYAQEQQIYYQQDPNMQQMAQNQQYFDQNQHIDPSQMPQYSDQYQEPIYGQSAEIPEVEPELEKQPSDDFEKKSPSGKHLKKQFNAVKKHSKPSRATYKRIYGGPRQKIMKKPFFKALKNLNPKFQHHIGQHYVTRDQTFEVEGGYYDDYDFYYLPDGSFYDPDGFYFNSKGYDKNGGYYDDHAVYHEGKVNTYPKETYQKRKNYYGGGGRYNKSYNNYHNDDNLGYAIGEDNPLDDDLEDDENKYTEDYIKYVLEQKYYENDKHLRNTTNDVYYLTVGNLPENTTKKDILTYLDSKGIEIKQITIIMKNQAGPPVAMMEIYKKGTAINTLKLCGDFYGKKQMIIEVDESLEKYY